MLKWRFVYPGQLRINSSLAAISLLHQTLSPPIIPANLRCGEEVQDPIGHLDPNGILSLRRHHGLFQPGLSVHAHPLFLGRGIPLRGPGSARVRQLSGHGHEVIGHECYEFDVGYFDFVAAAFHLEEYATG